MLLSFLFAANMAQALDLKIKCDIRETGPRVQTTQIVHTISANGHDMTNFETAYAKGFLSSMRGYGVINFISKETNQAVSFYGDVMHGRVFGGNFYLDAKNTQAVSVECVASH